LKWNTTQMLQSTTPRPTLHLAITPQPSVHRRSRLLHNHVRCLVYYIEEFKYYSAPNYYHLRFICITPSMLPTMSPTYVAYTYTWKFWSISLDVLKDCWNTSLIDKSQVHVYFLLKYLSFCW
jgi:hypothetical protein